MKKEEERTWVADYLTATGVSKSQMCQAETWRAELMGWL